MDNRSMTKVERQAIRQIRDLWPTMPPNERWDFVERLRHLHRGDHARTVEVLSGKPLPWW